jgi:hypothetical protein
LRLLFALPLRPFLSWLYFVEIAMLQVRALFNTRHFNHSYAV